MLRVLLPSACPVCGRHGPAPCERCWQLLEPAPGLDLPDGLDDCRSLLAYHGVGRELVARLKYRNARSSIAWLATGMAGLVAEPAAVDVVTWPPTAAERRRARGFDQAELLARRTAREIGRACAPLLARRPGPAQTGRGSAERRRGVAFDASDRCRGRRVLVVDDVVTTGSTLGAAARALRREGAIRVLAVTAARTPLKVTKGSADA